MKPTSDIEQQVKNIIAKNLDRPVHEVRSESEFIKDLEADSLAIVELVLALEEAFDIDIPDDVTEKMKTVQDAIEHIASKVEN